MSLLLFHVLQSCSIINHYRCHLHLLAACWEKRAVVHSVQKTLPRWTLPDNGAISYWITDRLMSGCVRPSSLLTVSAGRAKKVAAALYFLYVYAREALMVRSILLNSLFFFLTMSFKCINLYVKRTFSRTSACVRSNSDLVTLRTSQDLDWRVQQVGPIMFSSVLCSRRNSLQRSP